MTSSIKFLKLLSKPLFFALTAIAIIGFIVQLFFPTLYFSSQDELRDFVFRYSPWDWVAFIFLQIAQVILAPISHYVVGILGGAIYGPFIGAFYNWVGRVIGHIIVYWIGATIGEKIVVNLFSDSDLKKYRRFVNGTKKTFYLRLTILFIILFLPLFPDDELSYLVGLAKVPFKWYLPVLLFGHVGGSLGLAYIGAGIDTKDGLFWIIFTTVLVLTAGLVAAVYRLGKSDENGIDETTNSR